MNLSMLVSRESRVVTVMLVCMNIVWNRIDWAEFARQGVGVGLGEGTEVRVTCVQSECFKVKMTGKPQRDACECMCPYSVSISIPLQSI